MDPREFLGQIIAHAMATKSKPKAIIDGKTGNIRWRYRLHDELEVPEGVEFPSDGDGPPRPMIRPNDIFVEIPGILHPRHAAKLAAALKPHKVVHLHANCAEGDPAWRSTLHLFVTPDEPCQEIAEKVAAVIGRDTIGKWRWRWVRLRKAIARFVLPEGYDIS